MPDDWRAGVKASVPKLKLVSAVQQVRESLGTFNLHMRESGLAPALVRGTSYWVHDAEARAFAPSKFVAFEGITFDLYAHAQATGSSGDRFDGHVTRTRIEKIVGLEFAKDTQLAEQLQTWRGPAGQRHPRRR